MENNIDIELSYKSTCFDSFDELMECAGHTDPLVAVLEALHIHDTYTSHVINKKNNMMVVYHQTDDLATINDGITDEHREVGIIQLSIPESEFATFPEGFTMNNIGEKFTRALALYEMLKLAESQGMKMGIFNSGTNLLAGLNLAFAINNRVYSSGSYTGPKSPYIQ